MDVDQLIAFERDIASVFSRKEIAAPIHLSDGNERQLIEIFKQVRENDWVLSTWRSHYHALLHGVDPKWLKREIVAGRSIALQCPEKRLFCSAIVGGIIPIAVGIAIAIRRLKSNEHVWAFVGDMTAMIGVFDENVRYSQNYDLPVTFVIEDNGTCIDKSTESLWGLPQTVRPVSMPHQISSKVWRYEYSKGVYPHTGSDQWVQF